MTRKTKKKPKIHPSELSLPLEVQAQLQHLRDHPLTQAEILAATTTTEDDLDRETLASMKEETRVHFPMSAWEELGYLVEAGEAEPWTDFPSLFILRWEAVHGHFPTGLDDIGCEGEEEGEEWAFYCRGLSLDDLVTVVKEAVPEGWTAAVVPPPPDAYYGTAIEIQTG